jgi:hypothetical protein
MKTDCGEGKGEKISFPTVYSENIGNHFKISMLGMRAKIAFPQY